MVSQACYGNALPAWRRLSQTLRRHAGCVQVLGTLILWVGWYGFNAGSTGCMYGCMQVASLVAVNTTLAAGAGGLTGIALHAALGYPGDIVPALNGILAGIARPRPMLASQPWRDCLQAQS